MCAGSWKASGREERPGSLKFHSRSGRIDQLARSFHHAPSLLCRSRESRYGARDRLNGSFQQRISIGSVSEGVAVTFVTRTGARAVFEKENKKIVDKSRYTALTRYDETSVVFLPPSLGYEISVVTIFTGCALQSLRCRNLDRTAYRFRRFFQRYVHMNHCSSLSVTLISSQRSSLEEVVGYFSMVRTGNFFWW